MTLILVNLQAINNFLNPYHSEMNAPTQKINLAEYYYSFLKNISKQSKIDLVLMLVNSLKEEAPTQPVDEESAMKAFFEAFRTDLIGEELLTTISDLKKNSEKTTSHPSSF